MNFMQTYKRYLLGICLLLSMLILAGCSNNNSGGTDTLAAIKERGKLIVGVKYDTNLFGLKDPATGEVNGFDVDIAKALAKKIFGDENKLELKSVVSKTRIPMLQQGDIDAIIATMTITSERSKQVLFTDPYFDAGQSLLVKKGSPIKSIKDIKSGVRVVSVKGSTSAKRIHDMTPNATLLQFDNYQNAFMALKSGKGDVLTTDNVILMGMSKEDPNYVVVGGNFSDEPYGIAVRKGDVEFADYINKFLKEIKNDGTYDAIYKKWLGSAPPTKSSAK